jgi:hypothetical protein
MSPDRHDFREKAHYVGGYIAVSYLGLLSAHGWPLLFRQQKKA